jgi:hypothetical protein
MFFLVLALFPLYPEILCPFNWKTGMEGYLLGKGVCYLPSAIPSSLAE